MLLEVHFFIDGVKVRDLKLMKISNNRYKIADCKCDPAFPHRLTYWEYASKQADPRKVLKTILAMEDTNGIKMGKQAKSDTDSGDDSDGGKGRPTDSYESVVGARSGGGFPSSPRVG